MKFGYKSETGAACFGICAVVACFVIPRQFIAAVLPAWAVIGRQLAKGAVNRARPVTDADSAEAQAQARFVMSRAMQPEQRPVAIVTGTNSGIGYWTAVGLAAEGYEVVITCRSAVLSLQTAERVCVEAERVRRSNPKMYTHSPETVLVKAKLPVECDDFDSVRAFAEWINSAYASRNVQVLVNNAGGMRKNMGFSQHHPNLEYHTAVNFLGPLLLTELLLPLLEKNGGRVVYVASEAHRIPQGPLMGKMFGPWLSARGRPTTRGLAAGELVAALKELNQCADSSTGPLRRARFNLALSRYGASKLLNTYHAHVVARRYRDASSEANRVYACSLHPGCVATNISRSMLSGIVRSVYLYVSLLFLKTCEEGAETTLHCAMCPREELDLVAPPQSSLQLSTAERISPYFVECREKTDTMLLAFGWDVEEAEAIVEWGKEVVGLL